MGRRRPGRAIRLSLELVGGLVEDAHRSGHPGERQHALPDPGRGSGRGERAGVEPAVRLCHAESTAGIAPIDMSTITPVGDPSAGDGCEVARDGTAYSHGDSPT